MRPLRCNTCRECQTVASTQKIVLASVTGLDGNHAGSPLVRMWNQVLYDNPCVRWSEPEVNTYRTEIKQATRASVRPK